MLKELTTIKFIGVILMISLFGLGAKIGTAKAQGTGNPAESCSRPSSPSPIKNYAVILKTVDASQSATEEDIPDVDKLLQNLSGRVDRLYEHAKMNGDMIGSKIDGLLKGLKAVLKKIEKYYVIFSPKQKVSLKRTMGLLIPIFKFNVKKEAVKVRVVIEKDNGPKKKKQLFILNDFVPFDQLVKLRIPAVELVPGKKGSGYAVNSMYIPQRSDSASDEQNLLMVKRHPNPGQLKPLEGRAVLSSVAADFYQLNSQHRYYADALVKYNSIYSTMGYFSIATNKQFPGMVVGIQSVINQVIRDK